MELYGLETGVNVKEFRCIEKERQQEYLNGGIIVETEARCSRF